MIASITELFASASKIVFLMIAFSACLGFFMGLLKEDKFMEIVLMVLGYYFGYKPADKPVQPSTGTGTGTPIATIIPGEEMPAAPAVPATATIAGTGPAMAPGVK